MGANPQITAEKEDSKTHQKAGFKTKFGEVNGINNGKHHYYIATSDSYSTAHYYCLFKIKKLHKPFSLPPYTHAQIIN